ncbi:aminotransferase class III-fold pyridoxal phosphate-dependent enzyme [Candidatus Giovannonibacteria bacterium]|nr:aminotransferase class III-fold pyridoxal phosphate-dependent enzyme [Candidatus Giovannonibacteria bacterium]
MKKSSFPGPKTRLFYERMRRVMLSTSVVEDLSPVFERGDLCWLTDIDGNSFLDFTSQIGLVNTGHRPSEIVSAIREELNYFTGMLGNDFQFSTMHKNGPLFGEEISQVRLCEVLAEISPVPNPKVLLEVSGAAATNGSGKVCQYINSKKLCFAAFVKAFHGRHGFSLDLSSSKPIHKLLHRMGYCVARLPFPTKGVSLKSYFDHFISSLSGHEHTDSINAIYAEVVQGEGGINISDLEAFNMVRNIAHAKGILFVVDDIQTGFGRTGKMFASEYLERPPDLMVLSKSLGGGLPLGAVIVNNDLIPGGDLPMGAHSGTMPGTPLAIAAALANIKILRDKNLCVRSQSLGEYMVDGLKRLEKQHKYILDVDSLGGLMCRVQFGSKDLRNQVIRKCLETDPGLLLVGAGTAVIRFMPPLIVTQEEIDLALQIFEYALHTL